MEKHNTKSPEDYWAEFSKEGPVCRTITEANFKAAVRQIQSDVIQQVEELTRENERLKKSQMQWVKATERLPQHMVFHHIKFAGAKYTAYYDYSLKKFLTNVSHNGFDVAGVEWLDESVNVQSELEELKKERDEKDLIIYGINEGAEQWKSEAIDAKRELEAFKAVEMTPRIANLVIQIRDRIALSDYEEASHALYQIASPNFDKMEPWEEIEKLAALNSPVNGHQ